MILHLRATPGHSYRNLPKRVNCILNLGLYDMGVKRQKLQAEPAFEYKLSQCSNVNDEMKLIAENEEKNAELVKVIRIVKPAYHLAYLCKPFKNCTIYTIQCLMSAMKAITSFSNIFGKVTAEEHHPSKKLAKKILTEFHLTHRNSMQ